MKKASLKRAINYLMMSTLELEIVKAEAIRSRKKAKASAKPKWTRSIKTTSRTLAILKLARQYARLIPKRV